jgi:hypothetical protein
MMETPTLRSDLNNSYGLDLPEVVTMDALEAILAERIDAMINHDFNRLISLLYRIDVSEHSLRQLLEQNRGADGGKLIARLILERLWQKILTRRIYSSNQKDRSNADEEEKW